MRIATWNVNGLRARLPLLLLWLEERRPDLVGLQELKLTEDVLPRDELSSLGYRVVMHGQKAWNGVAILSREPVRLTQQGLPGQEGFGSRLISVEAGELQFVTVYCPNGKHVGHEDYPRKLAWFDALAEHVGARHRADRPTILCGDFNICPAPADSWNEELLKGTIFHTEEERGRFRRLIDWGFRDLFRRENPESREYTWWDYRGGSFHRNEGLRLDLLLATESAAPAGVAVTIDREYRKKKGELTASDHAPVFVDL
jgi:exodeoxyribonuclease-3